MAERTEEMPRGCTDRAPVAVIGLGAMGSRFARRLLESGLRIVVWNRSPDKAAALVVRGAELAISPANAAGRAEVIITSLADPAAVLGVAGGRAGIAAGIARGQLLIEMSTIGPSGLSKLRGLLPEDVALVDAPVLGSIAEAEAGTCLVFVGGTDKAVRDAHRILTLLGKLLHCGGPGSGAAAKLVANAALLSSVCALGETLSLADRLGLSRRVAFEVLAATPLGEQARKRRSGIEQRRFPPRYPLRLAAKDAELIAEAGGATFEESLRLLKGAKAWFDVVLRAGYGNSDYTVVLERIVNPSGADALAAASAAVPDRRGDSPAPRYRGLIFDLDGTIWRGGQPIDGVAEAFQRLRDNGLGLAFATNDPSRTGEEVATLLTRQGISTLAGQVFTAGAAAPGVIRHQLPDIQRVLVLGPSALLAEVCSASLRTETELGANPVEAVLVGAYPGFDYADLTAAIRAVLAGAHLFATGREAVYPTPDGLSPATGAIVSAVEAATGVGATIIGKPEPTLFTLARNALNGFEPLAAVGDNLFVDVAGAKEAGLEVILTLTGVSNRRDLERAPVRPDLVVDGLPELVSRLYPNPGSAASSRQDHRCGYEMTGQASP